MSAETTLTEMAMQYGFGGVALIMMWYTVKGLRDDIKALPQQIADKVYAMVHPPHS